MIQEFRRTRAYLVDLELQVEDVIKEAQAIRQENIQLKQENMELKKRLEEYERSTDTQES